MTYISEPENLKPRRFIIKQDRLVGFYIYVYEGNRCTHDYLQDTLPQAMGFALRKFQVPEDSWKRLE